MPWLPLFGSRPALRVPLVIYSRADCPLCDAMRAVVEDHLPERQYELRVVDVDSDRDLKKRFGLRVPVLEIGGVVLFEGRCEPRELRRAFKKRARYWPAEILHARAEKKPAS